MASRRWETASRILRPAALGWRRQEVARGIPRSAVSRLLRKNSSLRSRLHGQTARGQSADEIITTEGPSPGLVAAFVLDVRDELKWCARLISATRWWPLGVETRAGGDLLRKRRCVWEADGMPSADRLRRRRRFWSTGHRRLFAMPGTARGGELCWPPAAADAGQIANRPPPPVCRWLVWRTVGAGYYRGGVACRGKVDENTGADRGGSGCASGDPAGHGPGCVLSALYAGRDPGHVQAVDRSGE